MAEMEKEGRPPENKRSRKPAHPVKREINEEMKSFAENTMNELLGWYGYDKVELRDSDNLDIGETPQHISVLKENLLPKIQTSRRSNDVSPDLANSSQCLPNSRNGVSEHPTAPSTSTTSTKERGSQPVTVPVLPPPLIKPPKDEDATSVQIICAWCQKIGVKRYSLSMGSELKSFCSEKCFAACRRAYFKRNKLGCLRSYTARDDDGLGGKLLQHSFTQDTPRLVFKTNSDVLVCDWCKHIRHTKEYLDFGAGERRLQFCSAKCLNQYKMDIFYKETQAALPGALCNPGHGVGGEGKAECIGGVQLLTPESWGTPIPDIRRKAPSPGGPPNSSAPCTSSVTSSSDVLCSPSSSSSSAKIPTPRPHESPTLPPPPIPTLHPAVGVPSGSPPMVMTPRGPMPLPLFMEHQMMQQIRPSFLRPSVHPGGPNSPLSNPVIPGIGPPPPPRTLGPTSSPMHRPMISPHVHPSSNPNAGIMPPHPGLHMPGFPPFPSVNIMPNGPIPLPSMMNYGMPSLAPLVPPPTLLVPYPVIVPLPVPIPIPIPIPFNPKYSSTQPENGDPLSSAPLSADVSASGLSKSPGSSGGEKGKKREDPDGVECLSPGCSDRNWSSVMNLTVKEEDTMRNLCSTVDTGQLEGVIDLTISQTPCQQNVIQRILPKVHVKVEAEVESRSLLDVGLEQEVNGCHNLLERAALQQPLSNTELFAANALETLETSNSPSRKNSSSFIAPSETDITLSPAPSTPSTQPQLLPHIQTNPAVSCNVIVNGTAWHSLHTPNLKLDRSGDGLTSEENVREHPANGELEQEALKENNCSMREWESGKRGSMQDQMVEARESKPDPDSNSEEGEHAYTLPLLSTGGCVVIQPVPKPGTEKTAILSCSISAPLSAAGSPELEPPMKRRCLRIRNQNK
ncbi:sine oculis-binding protein homolog A isoform X1 [Hippocampus zosterae]|uniref:sine oculis-binding protein homolog A isoform X1 n=1 Tax=Hippocampus zosterae TaxID=109293 RepID=UPI00223CDD2D|nr:sine oculis-binding protein homolog A isoform X1 [Hippocampus zosterae]